MSKNNTFFKRLKRSTEELINLSIAQQNSWMEKRRNFARRFLKTLNIFARPAPKEEVDTKVVSATINEQNEKRPSGISAYWFPISCIALVILLAIWVMITPLKSVTTVATTNTPTVVPEPVVRKVEEVSVPTFDIVRIEDKGTVVIAGRWMANRNISILIDDKVVATERTDDNGEFVYAPTRKFETGNYTISLIGVDPEVKSEENVFVYISPRGYKNSISLLMSADGSTLLQAPTLLADGDLSVSKIDYLDTGRIVVNGNALPRLRVSLALNDKYLGVAKVSDHKYFGLGADVGQLEIGKKYTLTIRLHDGDGRTIAQVGHTFEMPEMTGDDNTYYTVRKGDCLWVIARNFLRKGVLFSIIAERNNIENPDLIYPEQLLQIPVGEVKNE